MPPNTDDSVEQLTHGLTYQRLANGIHKYVFTDMTHGTVDKFAEKAIQIDQETHEAGRHARSLIIMVHQFVTPYLASRSVELSWNTPPDLLESLAIVGDDLVSTLVRNLIFRRATIKTTQAARLFKSETDALAWLEERRLQLGD